jgi:Zn-dependent metalloprotease
LEKLLSHKDSEIRNAAVRTLTASARFRERRSILGMMPAAVSAGQERRTIYDAQHGQSLPGKLIRGEGDPASGDSAVNEAYDGLGATYDFYCNVFDRNSIDGHGMRLDASVHFGEDYDNAFWNGQQMVFGDGDGRIFVSFTKAIDVVGHELTHGVTQCTAALEYHDQSGALNESMSDVFGSLVKQYQLKQSVAQADWLIGAGILAPGIHGQALRSMKAPGTAYDDPTLGKDPQPDNMDDYNTDPGDNGGVHINSGIPNLAFYLVCDQLQGNAWGDPGHIWYTTLLQLSPFSQFKDCATISTQVAGTLFGTGSKQQQAVQEAWTQVKVLGPNGAPTAIRKGRGAKAERDGENFKKKLREVIQALQDLADSAG